MRERLIELALAPENLAEAAVRCGQIRLGGQNASIDRCGVTEFALRREHIAEVLLRLDKRGLQICCPGEMTRGPIQVAEPAKRFADVV